MDDLNQQAILDLYRHPLNKGLLSDAALRYKIDNPMCGDQIELTIQLDDNETVVAVGWNGSGCSVSQVGASLLTDYIKGKTKDGIKKITAEEITALSGLTLNPARLRCLLLAFTALRKTPDSM